MGQDTKDILKSIVATVVSAVIMKIVTWVTGFNRGYITLQLPVTALLWLGVVLVGVVTWVYLRRNRRVYRCHDQLKHEFGEPLLDAASQAGTVWHGIGGGSGVSAMLYGPYHRLRKGTYLASFRSKVAITEPDAYVYYDVAHSRGAGPTGVVQEGRIVSATGQHYRDGLLGFVVTKELSKGQWEWRVRLPVQGVEVWADTVTIERISGDTTTWQC